MSLTKEKSIDQITVAENGIILYREVTRIMEDGVQLSQSFHRTSLQPGQNLDGHPEKVLAIASTVWTPEVVDAYKAQVEEQNRQINQEQ